MSDRPSHAPVPSAAGRPDDARTRLHLYMLHRARERGDRFEAERVWLRLLLAELPRARGLVAAHRHEALPGSRVPAADIDDVVQNVFMRLHGKTDLLRGRSPGELRKFVATAVDFACRDYVAAHVKDDSRRFGSLDETSGDGLPSRTDRELARMADVLSGDGEESVIQREVLHQALALVDDDKRGILVMEALGLPVEEQMERLGISRDNVYQRRRRGLAQFREAKRELAGEDED